MAVGVVANVASFAPFTVLQLRLHLRALAIPHVIFLVVHLGLCLVLAKVMGVTGAALSWTACRSSL